MIRASVLGCLMLGTVLAVPGHAQDRSERARLDDFALPQEPPALPVDQLSSGDSSRLPAQRVDRVIAHPPKPDASASMPAQLSVTGVGGVVTQLPSTRESRLSLGTSVSNTADSAPGSVVRIGGKDRCDPQLTQKFYAECLRILELRSAEFSAPEAPALSAEQKLLVEQRQREEGLTEMSTAVRLRYATATQPDADLPSNQELASIYLPDPAPPTPTQPTETPKTPDFGEVLLNLGFEAPPPPGN
jgi:hypothetical protein